MQGELFEIAGGAAETSEVSMRQPSWLDRFQVTLRLDHLSILGISALILYVLVFSFGVEKGKRIAPRELEAEKAQKEIILKGLGQGETPLGFPQEKADAPEVPKAAPALQVPPIQEIPGTQPAKGAGRYTIQVITFLSQSQAEEKVEKLKEKGYPSFIIPGGKFFQVCVDRFENMTEARQKLLRLKAEGFAPRDAYIRPLKAQVSL